MSDSGQTPLTHELSGEVDRLKAQGEGMRLELLRVREQATALEYRAVYAETQAKAAQFDADRLRRMELEVRTERDELARYVDEVKAAIEPAGLNDSEWIPSGIKRVVAERNAAREQAEELRQSIARLTAPGIKRAPWFYAPCSKCGAIEGMGLVTPRVDGELLSGHTSVWCAHCEHFGPPVQTNAAAVRESDRAAAMAWNAEFAAAFASKALEKQKLREILQRAADALAAAFASKALEKQKLREILQRAADALEPFAANRIERSSSQWIRWVDQAAAVRREITDVLASREAKA